jgi:uncharacterized repeat protein (TIGR01451 family)
VTKTGAKPRHVLSLLLAVVLAASLLVWPTRAQTDPGIGVTQTADPGPATVGQPLTFTVTVTNNSVPQHVGLKDFLSSDTELVSATPSQGTCGMTHAGSNGVECTLGELPSGGSATVEIVATPTAPGTMTNTAVGGGEVAPTSSDTATIEVNPAPE